MPTLPGDAKQYINSEFARRLEAKDPPFHQVLVEVEPGAADAIVQEITAIPDASLDQTGIIAGTYIPATVPEESIPTIARLDGVTYVHQDQLVGMKPALPQMTDIPFLTAESDPIRQALSDRLFSAFTPEDPYVGRVGISDVEVPYVNFAQLPPGDPVRTSFVALDALSGTSVSGKKYIPTKKSVDWIRDADVTGTVDAPSAKVGVLDTGHTPVEPANGGRFPHLESLVPGESPLDLMGHGSWCTYTVAGQPSPTTWGTTTGVAPNAIYGHFKCLNTFPGFGRTSWILKAMERALAWGADVISMSLGGAQQGPIAEDPYCRFIRQNCKENAGDEDGAIFVMAAGNSGPGKWTIGSPGVSEKAITVGSWSLTDAAPAVFSSRGPQGDWYADNPDRFDTDSRKYGVSEFVKPDVVAPGGGRENSAKASQRDELLHQTSTGWSEGMYDGLKDMHGGMKGTSMACPHVAGLVYRLYDAGIVTTAAEVKQVVRSRQSVPDFPTAAEGANTFRGGKNITAGFGAIKESVFVPE